MSFAAAPYRSWALPLWLRHGGLLNDSFRVPHIRDKRRHVAKDLPLAAWKRRQKPLLGTGGIIEPTL
jgi:hypothetical protein